MTINLFQLKIYKVDKCNDAKNPTRVQPKCGQMRLPIIPKLPCLFVFLITKDTVDRRNFNVIVMVSVLIISMFLIFCAAVMQEHFVTR